MFNEMSDIQKTYSEIHQHQKNIKVLKLLHLKKKFLEILNQVLCKIGKICSMSLDHWIQ